MNVAVNLHTKYERDTKKNLNEFISDDKVINLHLYYHEKNKTMRRFFDP